MSGRQTNQMPLEGVDLNNLMPQRAPDVGTTTTRPRKLLSPFAHGSLFNRPIDWKAETENRIPQRDLRAEDVLVEQASAGVDRSSLDGRGLVTARTGQIKPEDILRAPIDAIKSEMFTYDTARWLLEDSRTAPDPDFRWNVENVATYTQDSSTTTPRQCRRCLRRASVPLWIASSQRGSRTRVTIGRPASSAGIAKTS